MKKITDYRKLLEVNKGRRTAGTKNGLPEFNENLAPG
jgi:hypothetical protein